MCMGPFAYGRPHVTRVLGVGFCSGLTCLSVSYTSGGLFVWCYLRLMGLGLRVLLVSPYACT